jgi:hypothetical protein
MMGSTGHVVFLAALVATMLAPAGAAGPLPASAPGDPTPHAPNAIRIAQSTRVLDSLEGFEIRVDLEVFEVELPPAGGRSAAEVRAAPPALRALFEDHVRNAIVQEAARVLPDARVRLAAFDVAYGDEDLDADPYYPPVQVHARLRADFTPAFFGLPATATTSARELARAFLYSGGVYALNRELEVPVGYDVRHSVEVPPFLEIRRPNAPAGARLDVRTDNFEGAHPGRVDLHFAIRLRDGAVPANVLQGPLVKARFVVDDHTPFYKQALPFLGGEYQGTLDLDIDVHSLDASLFGAYPLPRQVALDRVSADLLRIALQENLVQRADVQTFFETLIRRSLEEGFGPQTQLRFDWDTFGRSLNQPIGGADGTTVAPLTVRAHAVLPFTSNKMFVSSSLGRLFAMTLGSTGSFDLVNDGMWDAEYTVAYPEGVHVKVSDTAGLLEARSWSTREGFHVRLPRGAQTTVHVEGRTDFDPAVFGVGALQLALAGFLLWGGARKLRGLARGRWTGTAVQE